MGANTDLERVVRDLFQPVEQSLQDLPEDRQAYARAQQALQEAVAQLEAAADEEWGAVARLVNDLLEIAGCAADEAGEIEALTGDVRAGVTLLRDAMVRADEPTGEVAEFAATARERWSSYLQLLAGEDWDNGPGLGDDGIPVGADDTVSESSGAASPVDVQMILQAVAGGGVSAAEPPATEEPVVETSPAEQNGSAEIFADDIAVAGPPVPPRAVDTNTLDAELMEAYQEDAGQCLASMERIAMDAGGPTSDPEVLRSLCRDLHTLKGASASVGFTHLAGYLHQVEEWLEGAASSPGAAVDLDPVLVCVDTVRSRLGGDVASSTVSAAEPQPEVRPAAAPQRPVVTPAATTTSAVVDEASSQSAETLRVKASQVDQLMDQLADLVMFRSRRDRRVTELTGICDHLSACVLRLKSLGESSADLPTMTESVDPETGEVLPPALLSRQHEHYLSEVTSDIAEIAGELRKVCGPVAEENRTISQFIRQFRHELIQLRRMPVSGLFRRLQRAAHDAARVEGKQVRLSLVGEHAGLERSLQEKLYEPLLHLIRNAVSHGIETGDDRAAAGKDPVGTITLEAMGSSNLLVLEIRDDGRGLDYEAIRRRGIARQLIRPDDRPGNAELARLIFHPGFSTREQVNEVAGRGVGMDVVATTLEKMHSRIEIESAPGRGTTIRLSIPLRSVIEHAMVFRSGGRMFALPIQSVKAVSQHEGGANGNATPFAANADYHVPLNDLLRLPVGGDSMGGHWLVLGGKATGGGHVGPADMIDRSAPLQRVAIHVDEILGPEEVVVRSLPPLLRRHPLLGGVTLSGASEIVLMLDAARLFEQGCRYQAGGTLEQTTSAGGAASNRRVLVADDSISARRNLVRRLQKHGYEIDEAEDGLAALDRLREQEYLAIFTDLEMPRMGGLDLLAEIKSGERHSSTPVVVVTSRDEQQVRDRVHELGGDGFLAKPANSAALDEVIERLGMNRACADPGAVSL
ncbi:Chemotaxis protein CheA [Maioricimonas rarisocia]|uniref:histidine kinase n=1 Tax=Maioricimonas rarisocia TaxID=2528026 RepID=A0A517ZD78_9PLAN|nr:response regulator [Maioricimonas rarisocia]QDU40446.1 Chemotaxis protein CheA [Maioricimonas rarisocia]